MNRIKIRLKIIQNLGKIKKNLDIRKIEDKKIQNLKMNMIKNFVMKRNKNNAIFQCQL